MNPSAEWRIRIWLDTLIHMDKPPHRKLRNVTRDWFKPGPIDKLSADMLSIARHCVNKMKAMGGECDFFGHFFGRPEVDAGAVFFLIHLIIVN